MRELMHSQSDFLPDIASTAARRAADREMAERQRYVALTVDAWRLYHALFRLWWPLPDLSTPTALRLRALVDRAYDRACRREWAALGRPVTPASQRGGHGR